MTSNASARGASTAGAAGAPGPGRRAEGAALSGEHFAAALGCFVLGGAGLVWIAPHLAAGAFLAAPVIGVAHLFTLGWITMTIMGALYRLLPWALGVGIRSASLAHATFAVFLPGVLLFAAGTAAGRPSVARPGVALLSVGVLGFALNLAATLARAPARGLTWWGLATGATNLVAVLLLGALLAVNLETGRLGAARLGAAAAHAHLALLGWVMPIVVGVGHRLLPVFLRADEADRRPAAVALGLLGAGAPALAAGLGFGLRPLAAGGYALALGGLVAFVLQVRLYFRHRGRPALDVGVRIAAAGVAGLAAAALLSPLVFALGARAPRLVTAYGVVGLLGGLGLFVVGHYYKIIPYAVWRRRAAPVPGAAPASRASDLVAPRPAAAALGLLAGGVVTLAAGVLGLGPAAARIGAALFAAGAAVTATQIGAIAWPGPAPASRPAREVGAS